MLRSLKGRSDRRGPLSHVLSHVFGVDGPCPASSEFCSPTQQPSGRQGVRPKREKSARPTCSVSVGGLSVRSSPSGGPSLLPFTFLPIILPQSFSLPLRACTASVITVLLLLQLNVPFQLLEQRPAAAPTRHPDFLPESASKLLALLAADPGSCLPHCTARDRLRPSLPPWLAVPPVGQLPQTRAFCGKHGYPQLSFESDL